MAAESGQRPSYAIPHRAAFDCRSLLHVAGRSLPRDFFSSLTNFPLTAMPASTFALPPTNISTGLSLNFGEHVRVLHALLAEIAPEEGIDTLAAARAGLETIRGHKALHCQVRQREALLTNDSQSQSGAALPPQDTLPLRAVTRDPIRRVWRPPLLMLPRAVRHDSIRSCRRLWRPSLPLLPRTGSCSRRTGRPSLPCSVTWSATNCSGPQ